MPKTKKRPAKRVPSTKPKAISLDELDEKKAKKRLKDIYRLEKEVEKKTALFDLASRDRRSAQASMEQAIEDLENEIREQRDGMGPLFDGVEGTSSETKEKKP